MSADERLKRLARLWAAERLAQRRRVAEERGRTSLNERVERGVALRDLDLIETDAAPGDRTLLWMRPARPDELAHARITSGTPCRLWWDASDQPDAVPVVMTRRRGDRVAVMVDGDVPDRVYEGRVHLDREAPESTFDRGAKAIRAFADAKRSSDLGRLRAVLFEDAEVDDRGPADWTPSDPALNEPQRAAVDRALRRPEIALVHGPPGTGKTRTLCEIVVQCVRRGERVLVTAASNAAVDNLAERLVDAGVDLVRLGHPARVSEALEAHTLDALMEASGEPALARQWVQEAEAIRRKVRARSARGTMERAERRERLSEARRLLGDARHHLRRVQRALTASKRVICTTAAGVEADALGGSSPDSPAFDVVVLDEATQAPDPIALVALARAPRAVLAGDPHQLPPTVVDVDAAREGLGTTLFERRVGDAVMLEVQHRMHAGLMQFPSASKYDGRLIAAPSVASHRLLDLGVKEDPLRPGPLVFVDVAGKGWDETRSERDPSTSNPAQAQRTVAEVRRLLSRGLLPGDVAVITPYAAQARLIRDGVAPVEVGTIDSFQGREKEAIVLDLVRSNAEARLGFLNDTRRMNVALTRARRFLLVIGDSATLGAHPYYASFLEAAEQAGAWVSAWTDEAEELT